MQIWQLSHLPRQPSIYVYERSTCRYVRLNALNVPHVSRACFIAPNFRGIKHVAKPCWMGGWVGVGWRAMTWGSLAKTATYENTIEYLFWKMLYFWNIIYALTWSLKSYKLLKTQMLINGVMLIFIYLCCILMSQVKADFKSL